ncbi:hypothetical protein A0J61_09029, partial [Choanephora cucurbitarum]
FISDFFFTLKVKFALLKKKKGKRNENGR